MSFVDDALRLQYMLERKFKICFKKIGVRFLVALLSFSLICYAAMSWLYFTLIEPTNIFTTRTIPFVLNPAFIISICSIIFIMLFLTERKTVDVSKFEGA